MAELEYNHFKAICRKGGLKATSQRFIIYKRLLEGANHPTADRLYDEVSPELPGLSRDTVYRTLNMLADCGLAVRLVMPGGAAHFDGDAGPHHHFLCEVCGSIFDFNWPAIEELPWPVETWDIGTPKQTSVLVVGGCRACASGREPLEN